MNARPQRRRVSKAARERGEQLVAAAKSNSLPRVQQILQMLRPGEGEGVDVGRDPIRAATPLFWAVDQDNAAMTTALLNAGADVNATDNCNVTAAHHACYHDCHAALQALLAGQPDLNIRNNGGWLAMDDAVNQGNNTCAIMLARSHLM